jgi:hypothetical protein
MCRLKKQQTNKNPHPLDWLNKIWYFPIAKYYLTVKE